MAIDYLLAVKCEPQQVLGAQKLVELHRTRVLARSALLHMREDGDQREPKEIEIQLTMRNPEGDSARGVTLQDLLNEAAPLDRVSDACKSCPAELPREFACHRRIRYPIPERVEEWLMARMPINLQCAAGALLVRGPRRVRLGRLARREAARRRRHLLREQGRVRRALAGAKTAR